MKRTLSTVLMASAALLMASTSHGAEGDIQPDSTGYPTHVIDRPLVLPAGLGEVTGQVFHVVDTNGVGVGLALGVSDKVEVRAFGAMTLNDGSGGDGGNGGGNQAQGQGGGRGKLTARSQGGGGGGGGQSSLGQAGQQGGGGGGDGQGGGQGSSTSSPGVTLGVAYSLHEGDPIDALATLDAGIGETAEGMDLTMITLGSGMRRYFTEDTALLLSAALGYGVVTETADLDLGLGFAAQLSEPFAVELSTTVASIGVSGEPNPTETVADNLPLQVMGVYAAGDVVDITGTVLLNDLLGETTVSVHLAAVFRTHLF